MRKFFSVFSWGTKIFCPNFMGYEIFFGILRFHSAPVPGIKTDRSLNNKILVTRFRNHMHIKCRFFHEKPCNRRGGNPQLPITVKERGERKNTAEVFPIQQ